MITATEQLETYLATFSEFRQTAVARDLAWLRKLREDAFARFCETGFPTTHDEDWRFTNVTPIAKTAWQLPVHAPMISREQLAPYNLPGAVCQLVFVNGRFARELSSVDNFPSGVSTTRPALWANIPVLGS